MEEKLKKDETGKELKALKRKVATMVKKFTKDVQSEGKKAGMIMDVAVKISLRKGE